MRRNIEQERAWTQQAALCITDPEELIEACELRARRLSGEYVTDPMMIRAGLNRVREVAEEIEDGRNHMVFHMQLEDLTDEELHDCLIVLRHLTMAYDVLKRLY